MPSTIQWGLAGRLALAAVFLGFICPFYAVQIAVSQNESEWKRTFGGAQDDVVDSVQPTSDGGYILLGTTASFGAGSFDLWLIKTDALGNQEWEKTFGGSKDDAGTSIQQTSDGGYILLGFTESFGAGSSDVWLIKTDAHGNQQWEKTFGGSEYEGSASVQQASDGGYILLGFTESFGAGSFDLWLIKTDALGNQEWEKTFGGSKDDAGTSIQQTSDGGYILLGFTESFGAGSSDVWLIKTDAHGNQQWEKTFGGSEYEGSASVQQAPDGGYILLGNTESFGAGSFDLWLIKTDAQGNQQWEKTFGGTEYDGSASIQQTPDGGYILLGNTASFGTGGFDLWLIKTDVQGNQQWEKTFGGRKDDYGVSVQRTPDEGYILFGFTDSFGAGSSDVWLIKTQTPAPTEQETTSPRTETPTVLPTPSTEQLPVIFDDDGSPDGTAALFYLLSHPGVSVEAISISYGEAHPQVYIQHIGRKLDELGIGDIPLGAGQDAPLAGNNEFPEEVRQAASDFWGLPIPNADKTYPVQDAAELMVSIINQSSGPVTLFVSGPCTNLAQALRLDPGIRDHIAAVYIMGGALYVPGNLNDLMPDTDNTVAEWNIYADPQAAKEVFESGLDIYLVALDATNRVFIGSKDIEPWRLGGETAQFAADIYDLMFNSWGKRRMAIWDLMTAAIMVKPDLCGFHPLHVDIVTQEGFTSGQTVVVPDEEPNIHACLDPDVHQIKQTLSDVFSSSR